VGGSISFEWFICVALFQFGEQFRNQDNHRVDSLKSKYEQQQKQKASDAFEAAGGPSENPTIQQSNNLTIQKSQTPDVFQCVANSFVDFYRKKCLLFFGFHFSCFLVAENKQQATTAYGHN